MNPGIFFIIQQEQRNDLLKQLETERMIRAAGLGSTSRWKLVSKLGRQLGSQLAKYRARLLQRAPVTQPCCSSGCC